MSQDIFIYSRWKAVQGVVAVQTHRDRFTAFVHVSEESRFPAQVQVDPMAWAEVTESVRWGVSCTSCATAYSEPLALTEGSLSVFLSVSLSQKSIVAGFPCLFPPQHPSLSGSCPLSFLVHHPWATGLEICWLEGYWFKFRVCWLTKKEKWPFCRSFHQNGSFICFPVARIKHNYTKKSC